MNYARFFHNELSKMHNMKKHGAKNLWLLLATSVVILSLNGCLSSNNVERSSYVVDYKKFANESLDKAVVLETAGFDANWVKGKITLAMGDMNSAGLGERIIEAYADTLYFNDTLHTHSNATDLASYMEEIANRVDSVDIEFDDTVVQGKDAYVRWSMSFKPNANSNPVNSVGMTHLRFNAEGKIILHQDYWDGVEGFYRTMPVLGFLLKTVKNMM